MNKKKKILTSVLIVASLVSLVFVPWGVVWLWLQPLPRTVAEQVNDATKHGLAGIIVYVDEAGKPPAGYAAGWKNSEHRIPARPDDLFKIASISKLYIAVATVKLVARHRLSLDDTLSHLLPRVAGQIANADRITLRMLLQHRSGIPDWINDDQFSWHHPPAQTDEVLKLVFGDPPAFEPGSRYQYSNTNYLLLGDILDRTLGYSHRTFIKQEILEPLGLPHTFGLLQEADTSRVASGYDSHWEGDVKQLDFVAPGGSMVATAEDVGKFLRALNTGSLLTKDEKRIYSSVYEYGHTGLLPGYESIARYFPDIDAVVVLFINTSGGEAWSKAEVLYNRIVKILRKQVDVPSSR